MNISASSYTGWHICNRKWYFEHVIKIERIREEGAAAFGKLYHAGLEAWWRAMDGGDMPWRDADAALVLAFKAVHENAKHLDTDPFDVAKAEAMLFAYHVRYFELDFVTVEGTGDGVEVEFDVELLDPDGAVVPGWRLRGRKDAIKRFNGRIKPVEHKTSKQEIGVGAIYWDRIAVDMQVSIYVDVAQRLGFESDSALYDVSRKPELRPYKKTPDEKRKLTKGKGCPHCGGRAGGRNGAAKGTGRIMVPTSVDADGLPLPKRIDVEVDCTSCGGSGWHEAPRLQKNQRDADETVEDYKARVTEELADDFDAHFRMATIPRDANAIAEARANLVTTTGIIGAMTQLADARSHGHLGHPEARRVFAQNTNACLAVYGAPCPYLPICKGVARPTDSNLYRIRTRREVPT